jgi:hypothetical protein
MRPLADCGRKIEGRIWLRIDDLGGGHYLHTPSNRASNAPHHSHPGVQETGCGTGPRKEDRHLLSRCRGSAAVSSVGRAWLVIGVVMLFFHRDAETAVRGIANTLTAAPYRLFWRTKPPLWSRCTISAPSFCAIVHERVGVVAPRQCVARST